jgi:hypothetical protein
VRKEDWKDVLKESFAAGEERCHAGCEDRATILRLWGKHVGAWCRACLNEITRGTIPSLDKPKGLKRKTGRR